MRRSSSVLGTCTLVLAPVLVLALSLCAHARALVVVQRDPVVQQLSALSSGLQIFLTPGSHDGLLRAAQSTMRMEQQVEGLRRQVNEVERQISSRPSADGVYVMIDRDPLLARLNQGLNPLSNTRRRIPQDPMLRGQPVANDVMASLGLFEQQVEQIRRTLLAAPPAQQDFGYQEAPMAPPPGYQQPYMHNPYAPPPPMPMDPGSFQELVRAVNAETMDDSKLRVIQSAADNHVTVDQVKVLISRMTFDETKVKAVSALAPRIVDRKNSFKLYSSFTFSASKEKVRAILR